MESPSQKQKLWLDDVRPNPEGWTWVKTLAEAKDQIVAWAEAGDEWTHASLDHDLGASVNDGLCARGSSSEGSGYDLVEWMIEEGHIPTEYARIHSWNPPGAQRMAFLLASRFELTGNAVLVKPYDLSEAV